MNNNFFNSLLNEIVRVINPPHAPLYDIKSVKRIFSYIGWNLDAISNLPSEQISRLLEEFDSVYNQLEELRNLNLNSIDDILNAILALTESEIAYEHSKVKVNLKNENSTNKE